MSSRFHKGKWLSKSRSCLCAQDTQPTGLGRELCASTLQQQQQQQKVP